MSKSGARNSKPAPRQPSIEITELKQDSMKFILKNTDLSMANAVRRTMISEVPTLAIETIEIQENTSPLFDEFLAHRIGLIPIISANVDRIKYERDCCAQGCKDCKIPFQLEVRNTSQEKLLVTTKHLKGIHEDFGEIQPFDCANDFDDTNMEDMETNRNIVITKLARGQALKFRAVATKGIGKEHAKFIPVAVAVFTPEPHIVINQKAAEKLSDEQQKDFVQSCPTKVFAFNQQSRQIEVEEELRCIQCQECVKFANRIDAADIVKVGIKEERFRFSVETVGQHRPQDILTMALRILREKHEMIKEHVRDIQQELA